MKQITFIHPDSALAVFTAAVGVVAASPSARITLHQRQGYLAVSTKRSGIAFHAELEVDSDETFTINVAASFLRKLTDAYTNTELTAVTMTMRHKLHIEVNNATTFIMPFTTRGDDDEAAHVTIADGVVEAHVASLREALAFAVPWQPVSIGMTPDYHTVVDQMLLGTDWMRVVVG